MNMFKYSYTCRNDEPNEIRQEDKLAYEKKTDFITRLKKKQNSGEKLCRKIFFFSVMQPPEKMLYVMLKYILTAI